MLTPGELEQSLVMRSHPTDDLTGLGGSVGKFSQIIKKVFLNLYSPLRDRAQVEEGQRERETDSEAGSRLQAVSTEPHTGLKPTNCEIMTRAKVSHLTD